MDTLCYRKWKGSRWNLLHFSSLYIILYVYIVLIIICAVKKRMIGSLSLSSSLAPHFNLLVSLGSGPTCEDISYTLLDAKDVFCSNLSVYLNLERLKPDLPDMFVINVT